MKITISSDELLVILSKKFGVTVTEYAIEIPMPDIVRKLDKFIVQFPRFQSNEKISAIKALRTLATDEKWYGDKVMNLGDAKDAIERWGMFRAFALKNGRAPNPGHYCSTME